MIFVKSQVELASFFFVSAKASTTKGRNAGKRSLIVFQTAPNRTPKYPCITYLSFQPPLTLIFDMKLSRN